MRKFAITDIHGHAATFKALLEKIEFSDSDVLYLLGDYVDRGPDSKGVIDTIVDMRRQGHTIYCLLGNHEETMIKSLKDPELLENWLFYGGENTLRSFGISDLKQVPLPYWMFIKSLDLYKVVGNKILVHAGLNFKVDDPFQDAESILWIRDWYNDIDYDWLGKHIIIHGHTPVPQDVIQSQLSNLETQRVINIDNGCFMDSKPGMSHLCALNMDTMELTFQSNIG